MKKRTVILVLTLVGAFSSIHAQDTIHFNNGFLKIVKVIQIRSDELTCKDYNNLQGPDYVYNLNEIHAIHFQNGLVQTYNLPNANPEETSKGTRGDQRDAISNSDNYTPLKFRTYKEKNDYYRGVHYYSEYGDPYIPWVSGVASYFVPGLGQMIGGETGRGFAFMAGAVGCSLLAATGISGTWSYDADGYIENSDLYTLMGVVGILGYLTVDIWSIVDAVHVAKVNNLYQRDLRKQNQAKLYLSPYIDTHKDAFALNHQPSVGLSFKVEF